MIDRLVNFFDNRAKALVNKFENRYSRLSLESHEKKIPDLNEYLGKFAHYVGVDIKVMTSRHDRAGKVLSDGVSGKVDQVAFDDSGNLVFGFDGGGKAVLPALANLASYAEMCDGQGEIRAVVLRDSTPEDFYNKKGKIYDIRAL